MVRLGVEVAERSKRDLLHGLDHDGVLAHSKIIIAAPDVDFLLDAAGVGNGELGRKPVDVVKVTVTLVCRGKK